MMVTFSSLLFGLSGMLFLDTLLCIFFMKKISEGLLELVVTALVFVIAKLLEINPISELNEGIFIYVAAGTVLVAIGVMFFHLFAKVIPASPYERSRKPSKTPAHRERES